MEKFKLKEFVYLVTDKDQNRRLVTGVLERETGIQYALAFNGAETWHYSFEIARFDNQKPIGFN